MELSLLQSITRQFTQELVASQAGEKTSLPFIRHKLSQKPMVESGELFQVFTVGGTIFKNALVRSVQGTIEIISLHELKQPIFRTKDDFLRFTIANIHPDVKVIGLNFAYPLTPTFEEDRLDGVLIEGTKEHEFHGLVGLAVGKTLELAMQSEGKRLKVAVANDTICLLLSGLVLYPQDQLAAGIVGSGLNTAIFLADGTAVNLESANFDKFPLSEAAKQVDSASQKKGSAVFEKQTAGSYLYQIFNIEAKRQGISIPDLTSTEGLDSIAVAKEEKQSNLAVSLLRDSAQLVACQLAGIVSFYGKDTVFNMEGSLFWKGYGYKEMVEQTVKQLLPGRLVSYAQIPHSGILGAAKLVA